LANVHLRNAVRLALGSAVAMASAYCRTLSFPEAVYERRKELIVN